jgi:pimeloyl-ACP methyl ester carboxylesterase
MSINWHSPRYVETNGIRMAVYEQGAGVPVVLSHGFPELAYSWRHQCPRPKGLRHDRSPAGDRGL